MSEPDFKEFEIEIDGETKRAKVPAANMEKWMRRMEARGIPFRSVGAPDDPAAPTPGAAPPVAVQQGETIVRQRPGYRDPETVTEFHTSRSQEVPEQLDQGEVPHPLSRLARAAREHGPGAARQWFDEQMTPAVPPPNAPLSWNAEQGIKAGGTDAENLATVAEGAALSFPLGRAATPLGRVGLNIAQGAGGSAISGQIHSDADTLGERGEQAIGDAVLGGIGGGLFGGASEGASALAGKAGDSLRRLAESSRKMANRNRLQATGATEADVAAIARSKGMDNLDALAEDIERLGLHKGEGPLSFLPQKPATYHTNAVAEDQAAGEAIGALLDGAGKASVRRTQLASQFDQVADQLEASPRGDAKETIALLTRIRDEANHLRQRSQEVGPWMNARELAELKSTFQGEAFNGLRALDNTKAEANRGFGQITKDTLLDRMAKPPTKATPGTGPDKAAALKQAYRDAEVAKTVQETSLKPAMKAEGRFGFIDMLPMAVGGGAGAATGGAPGAALGTLVGLAARREIADRAPSAIAGSARAIQRLAERGKRGAEMTAEALQSQPVSPGGLAAASAPDMSIGAAMAPPAYAQEAPEPSPDTTGQDLEAQVEAVLSANPETLGPYAAELQQAQQEKRAGDNHALSGALHRIATGPDGEIWRTQYLPKLQGPR